MQRPTDGAPFWFPEVLAAHTILTKLGYDPEDIYYTNLIDPNTRAESLGLIVRPPEARGKTDWEGAQASLALEPVDYVLVPDVAKAFDLLQEDIDAWNRTEHGYREDFMNKSQIRTRVVDLVVILTTKGLRPPHVRTEDLKSSVH